MEREEIDREITKKYSSSRKVVGRVYSYLTHGHGVRKQTPLVYQSTTSLGLGQVQMPRPKEVVATGAATWGSKKWYNFFAETKSSSPVKHENIHPLWHYLCIQSLIFGINLVSARWILERARTSIQTFYSD